MRSFYKLYFVLLYFIFSILHGFSIKGRENIPEGAAVVCANHSSLKDPIILSFAMGIKQHMRYMAKDELMRNPFLGFLLRAIGVFGVRRGEADLAAIKTALKILKEGGKVGIFPEGHRVDPDEATAAKSGAIMLASKTGAPILPVYIPREKKYFHRIDVVIGKPYHLDRIKGGSAAYEVYAIELMQRIEELKP